ncbi:hypothetical protein CHUAL_013670 [Chamberlinius hualienensis]
MASSEYGENFKGKVVVVTGAGSGIGAAAAIQFSRHGANLALSDINLKSLQETVEKIRQISDTAIVTTEVGNLCDKEFRETYVNNVIEKHGQIDILINTAGITAKDGAINYNLDIYDKVMDINARVPYHLSGLCVPYLQKTKGCIINMSSSVTNFVAVNELAYSMSKAAIEQLTKHQAVELAPYGVRVNSINPGVVITNLHHNAREVEIEKYSKVHLLNRCAEPEEIANLMVFVCSEKGFHFTGAMLTYDGGLVLKKEAS